MKYGYSRVSTDEQNVNQQAQLLIDTYGLEPENVIQEIWTGKVTTRPALEKLIRTMKSGDKLYVFHISRLGRKASEVLALVEDLQQRNIAVIVYELSNTDLTSPAGKLLLTMVAAVAEMELQTLLERQRIGIDRAKREGRYTGRKPTAPEVLSTARQLKANGMSTIKIAKQLNIGKSTLYRLLA